MLKVSHLCKSIGSLSILEDICLTVNTGEIVCIIGPSGSGKSTLLRCINYLEKPTKGLIELNGKSIGDTSRQIQEWRRKVAMVFQDFNIFELKTVQQNVTLAPVLSKMMTKEVALEEAKKVLSFVGMSEKINCMPETLSGGEKQRVAIARALIMHPEIILMDEPTSALDPELIQEVLKVIRSLASQNTTMIIVTHQLSFAKEIADRIVFMENGKIIEEGTPEILFTAPKQQRTREFIQSIIQINCSGD